MNTTKMIERINDYKKEYVFENYSRIVKKFKNYDKISKKKMLIEIYKVYSDYNNIIDICTERELKYLKKILDGTSKEKLFDEKYDWERQTLNNKFLIENYFFSNIFIPDEIIDNVKLAIKNIDYNKVKQKDEINELLVSYCKIQGTSLMDFVYKIGSECTGIIEEEIFNHIIHNKLFNYYVMVYTKYIDELKKDCYVLLYQDYYEIENLIDEGRKEQGLAGSLKIDRNIYKTMFYNDFDINNEKVNKLIKEIYKLPVFKSELLNIIKDYSVLNLDRKNLKETISNIPVLYKHDLTKFFNILDEAMDEMPSGVLNGFTPNQAKKMKFEEEKRNKIKDAKYIKQKNACLSEKDAKLFYKIYFGLLEFTNNKYKIKQGLKIYNKLGINPYDIIEIVNKFWKNKEVIVLEFCLANPYKFSNDELKITNDFKKGFRSMFIIAKYEKEYTAIMTESKTYMIKGINDNIDNIISYRDLTQSVITSIIPFKNTLIYDGIFMPYSIKMGNAFEDIIINEYNNSIKYYHL